MKTSVAALALLCPALAACRGTPPPAPVAGEAPPPMAEPELQPGSRLVEARADDLVRQMSQRLATAQAFSLEADEVYDEVPEHSPRRQLAATRHVSLQRPDRLAGDAVGDAMHRGFWVLGSSPVAFAQRSAGGGANRGSVSAASRGTYSRSGNTGSWQGQRASGSRTVSQSGDTYNIDKNIQTQSVASKNVSREVDTGDREVERSSTATNAWGQSATRNREVENQGGYATIEGSGKTSTGRSASAQGVAGVNAYGQPAYAGTVNTKYNGNYATAGARNPYGGWTTATAGPYGGKVTTTLPSGYRTSTYYGRPCYTYGGAYHRPCTYAGAHYYDPVPVPYYAYYETPPVGATMLAVAGVSYLVSKEASYAKASATSDGKTAYQSVPAPQGVELHVLPAVRMRVHPRQLELTSIGKPQSNRRAGRRRGDLEQTHMNRFPIASSLVAAVVLAVLPTLGAQQPPAQPPGGPQDHVAALKQSLGQGQAVLRQYEWIETTVINFKGEEKSRKQSRCYYGTDGKVQKVPLDQPQAQAQEQGGRGGRRGGRVKEQVVEHKKDEMKDYMESAATLIHQYVPPGPPMIQAAKDAGRIAVTPQAGGRVRLVISQYLQPGDSMTLDVDGTANRLLGLGVNTYLGDPQDTVTLVVQMTTLPDGAQFAGQTTLDAKAKNIQVVITNSGHRPAGR